MLDIGFAELLIFVVPVWALAALVVYWIIRLAVRHGIQDTRRLAQASEPAAAVRRTIARQQARYDSIEPD